MSKSYLDLLKVQSIERTISDGKLNNSSNRFNLNSAIFMNLISEIFEDRYEGKLITFIKHLNVHNIFDVHFFLKEVITYGISKNGLKFSIISDKIKDNFYGENITYYSVNSSLFSFKDFAPTINFDKKRTEDIIIIDCYDYLLKNFSYDVNGKRLTDSKNKEFACEYLSRNLKNLSSLLHVKIFFIVDLQLQKEKIEIKDLEELDDFYCTSDMLFFNYQNILECVKNRNGEEFVIPLEVLNKNEKQ